jgi:uncharacterized protein YeaO (DUF488 family)
MMTIKRVYDSPAAADGFRVLVDRLWPRGVTKQAAHVDLWLKDAAPTPPLRQWFNHDPARFDEFKEKYRQELAGNAAVNDLLKLARENPAVTLLYAAKDPAHNHAIVLLEYLNEK